MLGELVFRPDGRGRPEKRDRYGMRVLQIGIRPNGWWEERRVRAAAHKLARQGVRRVLVPKQFPYREQFVRLGLREVDPLSFLRWHSGELAVAALEQDGVRPHQGIVALRGARAERDMIHAVQQLCQQVRGVAISAPVGGAELAERLRREYGLPVHPDGGEVSVVICFDSSASKQGKRVITLYGTSPDLAGVIPRSPGVAWEEQTDLCLLAALWETGRLASLGLEMT